MNRSTVEKPSISVKQRDLPGSDLDCTTRIEQTEDPTAGDDVIRRQHSGDDVSSVGVHRVGNGSGRRSARGGEYGSIPQVVGPSGTPPRDVSGSAREGVSERPRNDVSGGRGWEVSQEPRLWMSPRGAVSPLHFDASPSCLLQVSWS